MSRSLRRFLEWIGIAGSVNTIVQAEFVRTLFFPTLMTILTGAAGFFGGLPLMWIIMATSLTFAGITHGMLRTSEYLERKNPSNKLSFIGVHFDCELLPAQLAVPATGGASQTLPPSMINTSVPRQLNKGQVCVELKNEASFPISCILHKADTEVAGITPPRGTFPRPASTLQPGSIFRIADQSIIMNGLACGRMKGKIDMLIMYGLPGKEKFELHLVGDLEIFMENYGLVKQVSTLWFS